MKPFVQNSTVFKKLPTNIKSNIKFTTNGNVANSIKTLGKMGAGAGGSVLSDVVAGRDISGSNAAIPGASSGASSRLTDMGSNRIPALGNFTNQHGVTSLPQMQRFAPRSWNGMINFSAQNTRDMYGSAIYGTGVGTSVSMVTDAATKMVSGQ